MDKLVFGSDPEFFAGYKKDGNWFVLPPVWFRLYGGIEAMPDETGRHPIFIDAMDELGVLVMEDGAAFEETVKPSTDWRDLFNRISIGKDLLSKYLLSKFPNDCFEHPISLPSIGYEVERWQNESLEFQFCNIFGCDMDYDADNFNAEGKVIDALKHEFRYGGGHIHVSGSKAIIDEPILAIQSMKLTAGLAYVAFSDVPELDKNRTYLYGKPAKYRVQKYSKLFDGIPNTNVGIEYRTPSNRWTESFEIASNLFRWVEIGIRELLEKNLVSELLPQIGKEASDVIINCNQEKARELLSFVESKL